MCANHLKIAGGGPPPHDISSMRLACNIVNVNIGQFDKKVKSFGVFSLGLIHDMFADLRLFYYRRAKVRGMSGT